MYHIIIILFYLCNSVQKRSFFLLRYNSLTTRTHTLAIIYHSEARSPLPTNHTQVTRLSQAAHMIGVGQFSDEVKVLGAVDVSVSHELEIVLIDLVLDDGRHGIIEQVTMLTLLD